MDWYSLPIGENDAQKRFDRICKSIFPHNSYGDTMQWTRKKILKVNNKTPKNNQLLVVGDVVHIALPIIDRLSARARQRMQPTALSYSPVSKNPATSNATNYQSATTSDSAAIYSYFNKNSILYVDKHILAIHKQAGEAIFGKKSIASRLIQYSTTCTGSLSFTPAPCHRLDTGTSGVLLCALSVLGARTIAKLQTQKKLRKFYIALLEQPSDFVRLTHTLYRNTNSKKTFALTSSNNAPEDSTPLGEASILLHSIEAITLKSDYSYEEKPIRLYPTIVILEGSGGKTHQIRAQCAASNYHLWGDIKYSSSRKKFVHIHPETQYTSFFLHAASILAYKDIETAQESNTISLPNSVYAPLPESWYHAVQQSSYETLERLDLLFSRLSAEWDAENPASSSTAIIALCNSLLGGVIG